MKKQQKIKNRKLYKQIPNALFMQENFLKNSEADEPLIKIRGNQLRILLFSTQPALHPRKTFLLDGTEKRRYSKYHTMGNY